MNPQMPFGMNNMMPSFIPNQNNYDYYNNYNKSNLEDRVSSLEQKVKNIEKKLNMSSYDNMNMNDNYNWSNMHMM